MSQHATVIFIVCAAVVCFSAALVSEDLRDARTNFGGCAIVSALVYLACSVLAS